MKILRTVMALSVLCLTFSIVGCGGSEPGEAHKDDSTPAGESAAIPETADEVQNMEPGAGN